MASNTKDMTTREIINVVNKLVGSITPVGESHTDKDRFENLKTMCDLVAHLMNRIDEVASMKDQYQHSIKEAGEYADNFMKHV